MTNLLITILTTSNLDFLKQSYNSIEKQMKSIFNYKILIVVNTLNNEYFDLVKKTFNDTSIIRTESNGKPGKGHNSLFKIFSKQENFDYLLPVDGDDILYPCALLRLEKFLQYNPDLLFLPFTDILSKEYPNNKMHYGINDKCYLNFNNYVINMRNSWYKANKSPFQFNINNTNTPGRLILCSKKALDLNLKYDDTLNWYDDTYLFLQAFETAVLRKDYNIYLIDDNDIYLYNKLNNQSVTFNLKIENENKKLDEEKKFRKNILNKFLAIRDWNLSKFTFLTNEKNYDFDLKKKIEFTENIVSRMKIENIKINKHFYPSFLKYATHHKFNELEKLFK